MIKNIFEEDSKFYPSNGSYISSPKQSKEFIQYKTKIDSIYHAKLDSLKIDYFIKKSRMEREYGEKTLENKIKEWNK